MQLIVTIILCFLIGAVTSYFANQRGRDPIIWFVIGMLIGIFGLLLLFLLPVVPKEEAVVVGESANSSALPREQHDYLVKDWFYYDRDRNLQGPIRYEKLRELWKGNEINDESFVWAEGMADWMKLEEVHNLYTHLQLG